MKHLGVRPPANEAPFNVNAILSFGSGGILVACLWILDTLRGPDSDRME